MVGFRSLALGIELQVRATDEGGRSTPLVNGPCSEWSYRPNWGLPTMAPPEQTAAPVLAFSRDKVFPGEIAHAAIVVPYEQTVRRWAAEVEAGVSLPMYEGSRVVGHATVLWRTHVNVPVIVADRRRFTQWLRDPSAPLDD